MKENVEILDLINFWFAENAITKWQAKIECFGSVIVRRSHFIVCYCSIYRQRSKLKSLIAQNISVRIKCLQSFMPSNKSWSENIVLIVKFHQFIKKKYKIKYLHKLKNASTLLQFQMLEKIIFFSFASGPFELFLRI